jgi:hypothetical protein
VEEDIPKVANSYTLQKDERERGNLRFEREQECVDGTMA